MIVREHRKSPDGRWCLFCGAKFNADIASFGTEATCNPRDDGTDKRTLRPEPQRRQFAVEDFDVISGSIIRIRAEADVRCPQNSGRTLYDCLRSSSPCGEMCEFHKDWIGPQP